MNTRYNAFWEAAWRNWRATAGKLERASADPAVISAATTVKETNCCTSFPNSKLMRGCSTVEREKKPSQKINAPEPLQQRRKRQDQCHSVGFRFLWRTLKINEVCVRPLNMIATTMNPPEQSEERHRLNIGFDVCDGHDSKRMGSDSFVRVVLN